MTIAQKRLCAAWTYLLRWKDKVLNNIFRFRPSSYCFCFSPLLHLPKLTTQASTFWEQGWQKKQHIVVELDVLHTLHLVSWHHTKWRQQISFQAGIRESAAWITIAAGPQRLGAFPFSTKICLHELEFLYFLCVCLTNLISSVAKQWTDQLCQRKLSSGKSQWWTSLLTYWSPQLRFPKTLPI